MENTDFCKKCGNAEAEANGYALPLCTDCRDSLARRPLPGWIRAATAVVGVVLVYALVRFPASLEAGVAFRRGQDAERAGQYAAAVDNYRVVESHYPESTLAIARLGVAEYHAGDLAGAVTELQKLGGRQASRDLTDEVNQVIDEISTKLKDDGGSR